jgi:hypothetical protein
MPIIEIIFTTTQRAGFFTGESVSKSGIAAPNKAHAPGAIFVGFYRICIFCEVGAI